MKKSLFDFENTDFNYNYLDRKQLHDLAKRYLRKMAKEIGLEKDQYRLSNNMGGETDSGEITLHTDKFYLQICNKFSGNGVQILYRACDGRYDYAGKQNNYAALPELETMEFRQKLINMQNS